MKTSADIINTGRYYLLFTQSLPQVLLNVLHFLDDEMMDAFDQQSYSALISLLTTMSLSFSLRCMMYTRWCSNKIFFIKVRQVVFLQLSLQLSFCLYPILNSILHYSVEMLHVYVLLVLFPNPCMVHTRTHVPYQGSGNKTMFLPVQSCTFINRLHISCTASRQHGMCVLEQPCQCF